MKRAYISRIEYYLPDKVISNQSIAERFPDYSAEKIANKVGIKKRHVSGVSETASDLAVLAAEKLFKNNPGVREKVDMIIFCSQSPDYVLPTTACIIQDRLSLSNAIGAIDINQGCSGFVYALSLASGIIKSGISKNVLVLTGDTYSKYIDVLDVRNQTIFGDAGCASLISEEKGEFGSINEFHFFTNGHHYDALIVKNGGARSPDKCVSSENKDDYLHMDGKRVFEFTSQEIPKHISTLLNRSNISKDDIDLFVPHQANAYMLNFVRKLLGIPKERFLVDMEDEGNTVSSTIPIAMKKNGHLFKDNMNIVLSGFGVGLSIASVIIKTN